MRSPLTWAVTATALLATSSTAMAHGAGDDNLAEHWWDAWTISPVQLVPIALVMVLYGVRAHTLGRRLPIWRQLSFYAGMVVFALALASPIDAVGEEGLVSIHMLQHALIGGIAPLLAVLGLTGAVLQPILKYDWVRRLSVLAHPLVALPLWVATLIFWHVPAVYEFGVTNDAAHALEHATFFAATALLWMPIVEPLPAPEWFGTGAKLIYLLAVWFIGIIFVNIFWFSGTVLYERYEAVAHDWGVTALQDQGNAGSVFMVEHMLILLTALVVLGFRFAHESMARQRLLEAGLDRDAVVRAVRHGRAGALARSAGVSLTTRPGID